MTWFESYAGSVRQRAGAVLRPRSLWALAQAVREHDPAQGGPITVRATGHAFHNQALGSGTMLLLDQLPHEVVLTPGDVVLREAEGAALSWSTLEATGWTPWDVIVRASLRLGPPHGWHGPTGMDVWSVERLREQDPGAGGNLCWWRGKTHGGGLLEHLPYCLVSSGRITVGGSLSGDGVWRFSGVLGRESDSVVWLDLLRSDGAIVRLFNSRWGLWEHRHLHGAASFAASHKQNDDWFDAVVGGHGLLGVIVRVKHLLLELDPSLDPRAFAPRLSALGFSGAVGGEAARPPTGRSRELWQRVAAAMAALLRRTFPVRWPAYPHSSASDLGRTGADLAVQALTWLRPADTADDLFHSLIRGVEAAPEESGPIRLPRRVSASTVAGFALILPNHRHALRALVGHLAFGRPAPGARPFRMWSRAYTWESTARLLRWNLVPAKAVVGEELVYRSVFRDGIANSPTANPIPECAFFMEGHGIAVSGRRRKPGSVQQAWTVPLEPDPARARQVFADLVNALQRVCRHGRWSGRAVRMQVCDVKYVPPGRALLCSSRAVPSLMLAVSIENVRGYRGRLSAWAAPEAVLAELTREFAASGVKLHLSKALYVDTATLHSMYGAAFAEFARMRHALDPRGLWWSDFAALIEAASTPVAKPAPAQAADGPAAPP